MKLKKTLNYECLQSAKCSSIATLVHECNSRLVFRMRSCPASGDLKLQLEAFYLGNRAFIPGYGVLALHFNSAGL